MRSDLGWRRDYFARRLFPASVIWINRGGLKFHAAGESASPDHKRLRSRVYGDGKLSAGCPSTLLTRERVSWIYFNRQGRRAYLEFSKISELDLFIGSENLSVRWKISEGRLGMSAHSIDCKFINY